MAVAVGVLSDTRRLGVPTAPGVNPMISIISPAHRTAANMLTTS
jgi:hypothetical protein